MMLIPVNRVLRLLDAFVQFRDPTVDLLHATCPFQIVYGNQTDVFLVREQLVEFFLIDVNVHDEDEHFVGC